MKLTCGVCILALRLVFTRSPVENVKSAAFLDFKIVGWRSRVAKLVLTVLQWTTRKRLGLLGHTCNSTGLIVKEWKSLEQRFYLFLPLNWTYQNYPRHAMHFSPLQSFFKQLSKQPCTIMKKFVGMNLVTKLNNS